jgi:hypothetical protein
MEIVDIKSLITEMIDVYDGLTGGLKTTKENSLNLNIDNRNYTN